MRRADEKHSRHFCPSDPAMLFDFKAWPSAKRGAMTSSCGLTACNAPLCSKGFLLGSSTATVNFSVLNLLAFGLN